MPIYEYHCDQCGETTEMLQKFSDDPLTVCPACGGHVEKLMSMNSFKLKGSGWYVTDYAGKSGQKPDEAKKPAASATETPAVAKTETPAVAKPAATA